MEQKLDIVVFGATGFTGKFVVQELNKYATKNKGISWGIAGRSETKLKQLLVDLEIVKEGSDSESVPIIIANVEDESSLLKMTNRARLIINCCGPYRFFGESVVKACIQTKTHHVDISGEPQYMEKIQLDYNKAAQEHEIYIISACGFDSIPADMGVIYLSQKFNGTLNAVESYLDSTVKGRIDGAVIHYATWESAIYGFAHANELKSLRSKLYPEKLPVMKPRIKQRFAVHQNPIKDGAWAVPFPGSDRSVVLRSQRFFYEQNRQRPIQMQAYLTVRSWLTLLMLAIFGGLFSFFSRFDFGRQLLLKYPKIFSCGYVSHEGPSEELMKNTKFEMTFIGEGWSSDKKLCEGSDQYSEPPNKTIIGKVSGTDPGYGATSLMVLWCAITVLKETDKLPNKGGVFTPGAAFANTSLISELDKQGIEFKLLDEK
uniref:Saccharopine dehydrogenase NADP binding domain-containing protein n=1 Tax=Cuerna arida TaxID=1464854 RepID=A0A1B6G4X9_9HEMI